jgi:hypothetical protein
MSSFPTQSTIFLPSTSTVEVNSDPFWIDSSLSSSFLLETLGLFEGAATNFDSPSASHTDNLLPPFEVENFGQLPAHSGDGDRFDFADFTGDMYDALSNVQPEDLYAYSSRTHQYAR